jgi:superfamily II DNA helicase RecQ
MLSASALVAKKSSLTLTQLKNLIDLRISHPSIPWTVLSATMAPSKRTRLLNEFKLGSCVLIQGPLDRKNLHFSINVLSVRTFRSAWEWKFKYILALIMWVFNSLLRHCS